LPDLVSLCLVDFHGGGTTSVSFNADTGSVIRETKKSNLQQMGLELIEGLYTTVMPPSPEFGRSRTQSGSLAFYITHRGELSFYRRIGSTWESTGTVCSCADWVGGDKVVAPCVAVGKAGEYDIKITNVEIVPPFQVDHRPHQEQKIFWNVWNWNEGDGVRSDNEEEETLGV
jgi:hypothetical protein